MFATLMECMDIYIKTWIQLAFPIYIIFLVVLLIITSRYSSRFFKLTSKRNPVATLATLILISYGKLFHIVLLAQPFSFAVLTFPDGITEYLWFPDGTVKYLTGKHIVLFIVALLILAFCIVYSFLHLLAAIIISFAILVGIGLIIATIPMFEHYSSCWHTEWLTFLCEHCGS